MLRYPISLRVCHILILISEIKIYGFRTVFDITVTTYFMIIDLPV